MTIDDAGAVSLLTAMLNVPSLCGDEGALASALVDAMSSLGFDARLDDVGNAIGRLNAGGENTPSGEVVILGHMDTVPGWIPVKERDGLLHGRGAVDAKGPLATAIVAAARAAGRAQKTVTVIGAVQEEGPSIGARALTARAAPSYLVIAEPSGWDSIVLGYKGSMRFDVEVRVPSGHSAGPLPGACEVAVRFWNDLTAWCAAIRPEDASTDVFDALTPSLLSMSSDNDGLDDVARLHISLRLPPGLQPKDLQGDIEALLPAGIFRFQAGDPAVRSDRRNPLVAAFVRSIRSEEGRPRFKVKTGTSDMNVVAPVWGCPTVAYGPGDSRLDHTPNEHVHVEEYLKGIRVLTRVLEEL